MVLRDNEIFVANEHQLGHNVKHKMYSQFQTNLAEK